MIKKLFKSVFTLIISVLLLIALSFTSAADYTLNDPYYPEQKNLSVVNAQFAWNKGIFGEGVKIAIIDSGLYTAAYDFDSEKIIRAKDYTSTQTNSGNYYCSDEIGHGSIATGIIAAKHNNSLGIAGIAPQAEIYIFKCAYVDKESGAVVAPVINIINAVKLAIDTYDCDIINVSLGLTEAELNTNKNIKKDLEDVVNYAEEKGVLFVAAAGNDGSLSSNIYYPASYDSVISVGSVREDGKHKYEGSQRNDFVNIMAPGENVFSITNGGFAKDTGTSFAAPHVTAAAALAKSLNPDLTAKELREAIYSTATPMKDRFSGHGLLNIQALLTYVKSTLSPGKVVYSTNGKTTYSYFSAPEDYVIYSPTYEDNILTSVSSFATVPYSTETFDNFYIWNKNSLTPWTGTVTEEEY